MKYLGPKSADENLATQEDLDAGFVTFGYGEPSGTGSTGDVYVQGDSTPVIWEIWTWSSETSEWVASTSSFLAFPTPTGGSVGQVLTKASGDDYDLEWANAEPGPEGPPGDWSDPQTISAKTAAYTLVTADAGKLITVDASSGVEVTVNGALDLSAGQRIDLLQLGTGQVTVAASGATVNGTPGLKLRDQYSAATLLCTGTDTYVLLGDLTI